MRINMNLLDQNQKYMLGNYAPFSVEFARGEGCYLYDNDGKKYLDFVAGIAVNALGHANADILKAIQEQAEKFTHISNLYLNENQISLAQTLIDNTSLDRAFFCNSGTEANEAAIKFARKYYASQDKDKLEVISFKQSFHGRTMGALAATGQEGLQKNFGPMLQGFLYSDLNDGNALKKLVSDKTAAIILEPIQGEGGVNSMSVEFMELIQQLKKENDFLLICDEIQTGLGRLGAFLASEKYGFEPDIVTLAKPLGGGLPLGCVLLKEDVAQVIKPGDHGTTFGGNPIACAVANVVCKAVLKKGFLKQVTKSSQQLLAILKEVKEQFNFLGEIKGDGLLLGISTTVNVIDVVKIAMEEGLLICKAGGDVIRILPPLVIDQSHIDEFKEKFTKALSKVEQEILIGKK